ncbi:MULTISPECIES: TetR/AcrR family transcriptional regulator [Enterococcus]|uniref:TetR/AcrR family transcriptional regulator n=1 Tax=Enterococcus TaxID=1350 RepID=UPI00288F786E|nr:TetR/AcrR family transcriptional regulator [Enterococcus avium]MDT2386970.1 TetR/AcrR family transcriptional regulator [Enterococcus avium]MDT2446997.1 TetR/AcrR family transcriptional regulator [Enterococcus avium]
MRIEKNVILQVAHDIFFKKGYKKTNISEIATKAKIAAGTFYNYFDSKESLFLEVYVQENERVRNDLISNLNLNDLSVDQLLEKIFEYTINKVTHNKILAEWNNHQISSVLHQYYASDVGKQNNTFNIFLTKTLRNILKEKKFDDDNIDELMRVYDLIYYLDMNITSSDFEDYEKTLKLLVKYFCKGVLTTKEDN